MFSPAKFLSAIAGLVYPTYSSWKALQTPSADDDKQWLTFWVVHAFLSTAESLLPLGWVPLYYELKLVLVLWLVSPQFLGAKFIYDKFIEPFMAKYAPRLEPLVSMAERTILSNPALGLTGRLIETYGEDAAKAASSVIADLASKHGDKVVDLVKELAEAKLKEAQAQAKAKPEEKKGK